MSEGVIIDNSFLAIGVHSGLIGLVLWFLLMWQIWKWLLAISRKMPDNAVVLAITAMWSTWISSGIFNSTMSLYPMLAIVAVSVYFDKINRDKIKNSRKSLSIPVVEGT